MLVVEAELELDQITPALFHMLGQLEPYGAGNHEPAFSARGVRLIAPPKILKDKHIKLKLKAGETSSSRATFSETEESELSPAAILAIPRCHPDGAAIGRSERAEAASIHQPTTDSRQLFLSFIHVILSSARPGIKRSESS